MRRCSPRLAPRNRQHASPGTANVAPSAARGVHGQVSEIVARWEWRAFGDDFGAAGERLAALEPERVQESEELYLLTAEEVDTVKVRDGAMDVKRLERVSEDGLEQWLPVM